MRSNTLADGKHLPSASLLASTESGRDLDDEDQDDGDVAPGIDEEALEEDDLDTDRVSSDGDSRTLPSS